MKVIIDYQGFGVSLTDERLAQILGHPEIVDIDMATSETWKDPALVRKWNRALERSRRYR